MLLFEPNQTQFDLRWQMFGVPVRVHPMFWFVSVLLGWNLLQDPQGGVRVLLVWIACVFVSILLHEFGHVFVGRWFGSNGHIVLYGFGGLAIGSNALESRWQRIAVSLAGPAVQLLLWGAIRLWLKSASHDVLQVLVRYELVGMAIVFLIEINLYWALLNLLPIWPLDGGQVARNLFEWRLGTDGTRAALWLSLITAAAFAINSLAAANGRPLIPRVPAGGLYTALLFGSLALSNYFELQQTPRGPRRWQKQSWERDPDYWKQ
jgi:Zn-dependent protease